MIYCLPESIRIWFKSERTVNNAIFLKRTGGEVEYNQDLTVRQDR
jgi:hypothetical protein